MYRWFAVLSFAVSDTETGETMKEKLTYCFITYNSNQLPKLLCGNKDTAAVFFNYFSAKKKNCARNRNYDATLEPRDASYDVYLKSTVTTTLLD